MTTSLQVDYQFQSETFSEAWKTGIASNKTAKVAMNEMVRILLEEHKDWSIREALMTICSEHQDLEGLSVSSMYRHLTPENRKMLQDKPVSGDKTETPKKDPPPEENALETENEFLKEQVSELQDALKQTEQFKPATQLQEAKDPTPELQLTDDLVFQYLRDRAKETGNILIIDRVGAGALVQALAQYKNSFGVAELFLRVIK